MVLANLRPHAYYNIQPTQFHQHEAFTQVEVQRLSALVTANTTIILRGDFQAASPAYPPNATEIMKVLGEPTSATSAVLYTLQAYLEYAVKRSALVECTQLQSSSPTFDARWEATPTLTSQSLNESSNMTQRFVFQASLNVAVAVSTPSADFTVVLQQSYGACVVVLLQTIGLEVTQAEVLDRLSANVLAQTRNVISGWSGRLVFEALLFRDLSASAKSCDTTSDARVLTTGLVTALRSQADFMVATVPSQELIVRVH